jgi:phosphoribosylaminoimidazole carboxylase (NCAIR synthetase)
MDSRPTVLCIVGALFGRPFLHEAKRLGWRVCLLTEEKLLKEAWPRDQIDEMFAVPDLYNEEIVRKVVTFLARTRRFDRIVGLGEFDVEVAASLREHMRSPGMGETTARYVRDKLAMREKAESDGIAVPEYCRVLNYDEINEFFDRVAGPYMFKPRMGASAFKISKIFDRSELWPKLEALGDKQSNYLLEKFIPGDLYHVDSLVSAKKVVYASVSKYGVPMLDLNESGGIFTSRMLEAGSPDEAALQEMNRRVIKSLGLAWGCTHIEYIKGRDDGRFYFLEAAARVGGARIPDIIFQATGLCLWHEWAKIELKPKEQKYRLPKLRRQYGGGIFTLAKQEEPDLSSYSDAEVAWVQKKKSYAGLIVTSPDAHRVEELLAMYHPRFVADFLAHVPYKERPAEPAAAATTTS